MDMRARDVLNGTKAPCCQAALGLALVLGLITGCSGAGGGGSGGGSATGGGGVGGGTATAGCGNGTLETNEPCEGFELRGRTCVSQGFMKGELTCTSSCTFDTSRCETCGDGILSGSEACDTNAMGGGRPLFGGRSCATEVDAGATGELQCDTSCRISASQCSFPVPLPTRGERCELLRGCVVGLFCDLVAGNQTRCRLHCPEAAIGSSQGCPSGETCVAGGREVQGGGTSPPVYVACTTNTDCAATYGCPDSGIGTSFCVRPTGVCQ